MEQLNSIPPILPPEDNSKNIFSKWIRWGVRTVLLIAVISNGYFCYRYFISPEPTSFFSTAPLPSATSQSGAGLKIISPGNGIYLGAYDWKENGQNPGVKEFETAIGKKVAIVGNLSYIKNYPNGNEMALPVFNRSEYERAYNEGYITTFNFEFRIPNPASNTSPQSIIEGRQDAYIKQIAQEIKLFNKPLFWGYQREPSIQPGYGYDGGGYGPKGEDKKQSMEGSGAAWNYTNYGCKTVGDPMCLDGWERYRDACRRIHDLVESVAPNRVTWVMGAVAYGFDQDFALSYPGDKYVDWVAINYYPCGQSPNCGMDENGKNPINYESISQANSSLNKFLTKASELAPSKPVILTEFGVFGNPNAPLDRSAWFKEFFQAVKQNKAHTKIKTFIYWQMGTDLDGGKFNNRIRTSNTADAKAWQDEMKANPNFWLSNIQTGSSTTSY